MNKESVLERIEEKLTFSVKNLLNGNVSDHDVFPSILWLLLENSKDIEKLISLTKNNLLENGEEIQKKISSTESNLQKTIVNLSKIIHDEVEIIVKQEIEKSEKNSQEGVKNIVTKEIEKCENILKEDLKIIVTMENKKTYIFLKWLVGLCIFQFIGICALISNILMR
jgi:hypothetical protein